MSGTTFDALAAAGTLREAGFEDRQAEAVAGVVRGAVDADRGALATKADIAALRADTRADIAALRADLDTGLAAVRADQAALRADQAALRADIRADIAALENRLTTRFFGGLLAVGGLIVAAVKLL